MGANSYTPRMGQPMYIGTDRLDPLDEMNKGSQNAEKYAALAVDAFIPCEAAYDGVTKRHTLTPKQTGIALPEVFTVRFAPASAFAEGDKLYVDGTEYTPAYTDSTEPVKSGWWAAGATVGATCVKAAGKAFLGKGFGAELGNKANQTLGAAGKDLLEWADAQSESGAFYADSTITTVNSPIPGAWLLGTLSRPISNSPLIQAVEPYSGRVFLARKYSLTWQPWMELATATLPTDWVTVTGENGWEILNSSDGTKYRMLESGLAEIDGLMKAPDNPDVSIPILTLPAKFKPLKQIWISSASSASGKALMLRLDTGGKLYLWGSQLPVASELILISKTFKPKEV